MKKLTLEDFELCAKIASRAMDMGLYSYGYSVTALYDIQTAAKFFNMRLSEWLKAKDFDFAHDVLGIAKAINHVACSTDFSNDPMFLPRFACMDESNE